MNKVMSMQWSMWNDKLSGDQGDEHGDHREFIKDQRWTLKWWAVFKVKNSDQGDEQWSRWWTVIKVMNSDQGDEQWSRCWTVIKVVYLMNRHSSDWTVFMMKIIDNDDANDTGVLKNCLYHTNGLRINHWYLLYSILYYSVRPFSTQKK